MKFTNLIFRTIKKVPNLSSTSPKFDQIDHWTVIRKINCIERGSGREGLLQKLTSYLGDNLQNVEIGNMKPKSSPVTSCIPPGSKLCLFFLLHSLMSYMKLSPNLKSFFLLMNLTF